MNRKYLNKERSAEKDATAREDALKNVVPKNAVDDRL